MRKLEERGKSLGKKGVETRGQRSMRKVDNEIVFLFVSIKLISFFLKPISSIFLKREQGNAGLVRTYPHKYDEPGGQSSDGRRERMGR